MKDSQPCDLKLIITSATIDAARFAEHFGEPGRPAPVIEVSGRLYPVEVRYRPPEDMQAEDEDDETDLPSAIETAVRELWNEKPGDVLVFPLRRLRQENHLNLGGGGCFQVNNGIFIRVFFTHSDLIIAYPKPQKKTKPSF